MQDINTAPPQEQFQTIKPTINMVLIFFSSLIRSIFLGFILVLFLLQGGLAYLDSFIFIAIGAAVLFGGLIIFNILITLANLKRTEYRFYNNRLEYFEGFLVKNRKTINYTQISNIGQRKGIVEGLFGLGTVYIDTAGSSKKGHELSMQYLDNPDQIYDWVAQTAANKQ